MGMMQEAAEAGFQHGFAELGLDPGELEKSANAVTAGLGVLGNVARRGVNKARNFIQAAGEMTGLGQKIKPFQASTHSMPGLSGQIATPGGVTGLTGPVGASTMQRADLVREGANFRAARRANRPPAYANTPNVPAVIQNPRAGTVGYARPDPVHIVDGHIEPPKQGPTHLPDGPMQGPARPTFTQKAKANLWQNRTDNERLGIVGAGGIGAGVLGSHLFSGGDDPRRSRAY